MIYARTIIADSLPIANPELYLLKTNNDSARCKVIAIAEDIADRIGIIHQGTLTALGTLKELQAQHAETQHGNEPSTLEDIFLTLTRPLARGTQNTEPRKDLNA